MDIFDEYEKQYDKFITSLELPKNRSKISGNVFSHVMRNYILKILNQKFKLSAVNSYIKGSIIEWDLLILKNTISEEEQNYNIYYPENVVCALEFKSSGVYLKKDSEESINYIKKYINELNMIMKKNPNSDIKYGYISLCEIPENLKVMKNNYKNNCFWITEGYYKSYKKNGVNGIKELESFLVNLINKK